VVLIDQCYITLVPLWYTSATRSNSTQIYVVFDLSYSSQIKLLKLKTVCFEVKQSLPSNCDQTAITNYSTLLKQQIISFQEIDTLD